jgi:iron complex transport system substrate-binding protein
VSGRTWSRRTVLLGAAGGAAAFVAGCGSSTKEATAPEPSAPATSAGAYPVSVPGKEGTARLAAAPTRVAAVGFLRDTDLALALGANLVGLTKSFNFDSGIAPWQNVPASVQRLDADAETPFERIAALHPDLILASDDTSLSEDYKSLSGIAPTLSYDKGYNQDSWQTMTTRAGLILGKRQAAQDLVTKTTDTLAAAAQRYPELKGKTFTIGPVQAADRIFTISRTTDASASFFGALGMTLSPKVTALPQSDLPGRSAVSAEQVALLDADIVMITYTNPAAKSAFESSELFQRLPAVRRGSYLALELPEALAIAFPSVLSIPYGVENVVPKVAAAAAKVG